MIGLLTTKIVIYFLITGGFAACMIAVETINNKDFLETMFLSNSMMLEKSVSAEEIEKEQNFTLLHAVSFNKRKIIKGSLEEEFYKSTKDVYQNIGDQVAKFSFSNEYYVPKLLDTENAQYGWQAIMKVHQKTFEENNVTTQDLINGCRKLLRSPKKSFSREWLYKKYKIATEFCAIPIKIKEKLTYTRIQQYQDLISGSLFKNYKAPNKKFSANNNYRKDKFELDWCNKFLGNYTVGENTITVEELDFVRYCHSVFKPH